MIRINVFKTSAAFSKFFIVFGGIFAVFGTVLIIEALTSGFDLHFPSGDWSPVIFTLQGLLFIVMGATNLLNRKYYIEWDEETLRFLLPGGKRAETIRFAEILSTSVRLFEIEIVLSGGKRIIDLNNLRFEDLRRIKEKFETLGIAGK
jgi:hypothetical protein